MNNTYTNNKKKKQKITIGKTKVCSERTETSPPQLLLTLPHVVPYFNLSTHQKLPALSGAWIVAIFDLQLSSLKTSREPKFRGHCPREQKVSKVHAQKNLYPLPPPIPFIEKTNTEKTSKRKKKERGQRLTVPE